MYFSKYKQGLIDSSQRGPRAVHFMLEYGSDSGVGQHPIIIVEEGEVDNPFCETTGTCTCMYM